MKNENGLGRTLLQPVMQGQKKNGTRNSWHSSGEIWKGRPKRTISGLNGSKWALVVDRILRRWNVSHPRDTHILNWSLGDNRPLCGIELDTDDASPVKWRGGGEDGGWRRRTDEGRRVIWDTAVARSCSRLAVGHTEWNNTRRLALLMLIGTASNAVLVRLMHHHIPLLRLYSMHV